MSSDMNWQSSVTSMDRYENIQTIKAAIEASDPSSDSGQKDAFSIENEAYKTSMSLDEYNAKCRILPAQKGQVSADAEPPSANESITGESPGVSIGSYHNCHFVASGVTADVFRAQTRALKVITETRNMDPHNPIREAKILQTLRKPCIPLLETFRDQEQRFVLVFPFMPVSLETLIRRGSIPRLRVREHFLALFNALEYIHSQGIIHRDVKPSALLMESPDGPAYLSDFGTAWHPNMSANTEPQHQKILDIGTGAYRAPEVLFGDMSYGPAVDMWGAGVMLTECCRDPPRPIFESRPVHEDGNQLGLILSIFKTIGTPTPETWPEAARFRTPPFDMYKAFDQRTWEDILPEVEPDFRHIIAALVKYNSSRATAAEALQLMDKTDVAPR